MTGFLDIWISLNGQYFVRFSGENVSRISWRMGGVKIVTNQESYVINGGNETSTLSYRKEQEKEILCLLSFRFSFRSGICRDCNGIQTPAHLVSKQTLKHLAKLALRQPFRQTGLI